MYTFKLLFFCLLPFLISSQSFPSDTKVIADVKKYHGKMASATVQNDWKLEKEAGYSFGNMAKRVVAGTTIKENGISKKIIGLAIYTRGGQGESWNFSRYFITNSEVVGAKLMTEDVLKEQIIALLESDPIKVFPDFGEIVWVHDITFPEGLENHTDRTGDVIYAGQITFMRKFVEYEYPFEGGIRTHISPLEIYTRLESAEMKVKTCVVGYSDANEKKYLSEKDYKSIAVLGAKPFKELFGLNGPDLKSTKQDNDKSESNKPVKSNIMSKLKIKGS
jgi:hypothetical protein